KEVIRQGIVASISGSTVWRWLDHDAIRPWTFRSWIFPRDPHFEAKAGVVLDLYARQFEGNALGDNDFVVSADEKTSIQARCRCHPPCPPPNHGRCSSSMSTTGAEPCSTSPPGTWA